MIILKIGGGQNINWDYIVKDIAFLIKKEPIILVHGASFKRDQLAKKLKHPTRYITAPSGNFGVYTDKKALEILVMVYAGLVNKQIVAKLQQYGVNAVGLSGADGRIWSGKRKEYLLSSKGNKVNLIKDTYTGKVEKVNTKLLKLLLDNGFLPVITQPAISFKGELINTDNDRNLAVMAKELKVKKLVVLFSAPGLLKNPKDESSLIIKINKNKLDDYSNFCQGRMKKKLMGAKEAILAGVKEIYWGDARIKNPIINVLKGKGTIIS